MTTGGLTGRLRALKRETLAVTIAARDPRTPWPAKAVAALVLAYALSPIDLIPDFIPVLGHLDDLVLVPLGIWLVIRLVPPQVMNDARRQAADAARPERNPWGWVLVGSVWAAALGLTAWWLWPA